MVSLKVSELLLTLIPLSILLTTLILPALRTFSTELPETFLEETTQNLSPFDYFYLSTEEAIEKCCYKVDSLERGNINIYYDPSYNDSLWSKTNIPFLFKAGRSNNSIWVRSSFYVPSVMKEQRLRLIFSGVWGFVKVWLNGIYLGEHASYFSPFFFDIDDVVRKEEDNVLTLYIESPVQDSYESRTYPVGIYSFSEISPNLHNAFIGVWKSILLVGTRDPVINLVLIDVKQYSDPALVSFRILIKNKGDAEKDATMIIRIGRFNSSGIADVEQSFNIRLSPKETKWSKFEVSIPHPTYWFPWDVGIPNVYFANISLYSEDEYSGSLKTIFGIRFLEGSLSRENPYIRINSISVFLRGGAYFSKLDPPVDPEEMIRNLRMLKSANINFLRSFAHVEPKEFYELTSVEGILTQLDFPLAGSYPALDRFQKYSDSVKKQLTELILLTYNYPSIIIICPHTLPGWLNKKSPYYGSGTNIHLDYELSILIENLNRNIITLPYSGDYDKYFDFGWGSGSWTDYISYREAFPNIISPVGLPVSNSSFWKGVATSSCLQILQVFREHGFAEALPAGLVTIENLSELIDISQEYQSIVLTSAIDRARMLKSNFSIGVCIFPLTDYLSQASGSIIDYYGFEKKAYYGVKNAFNPVHNIILVDGDYRSNLTSLFFNPGATVKINFWLVNDAVKDSPNAILNWSLKDLTSNKILYVESIELKLPPQSSGAMLVEKHVFEAPYYTDGEHVLEVSTRLSFKDGKIVDTNSKRFVVKPASLVRISLTPKPKRPQVFLLLLNESLISVRILNETVIGVPSDLELTLVGPSLNKEEVYVPERLHLGKIPLGEVSNITIKLFPGAIARVLASVPSPPTLKIPLQKTSIILFNKTGNQLITDYSSEDLSFLSLLNITGNTVVVPAETPLSLLVSVSTDNGETKVRLGSAEQPIKLPRNIEAYFDNPALVQVRSNQPFIDDALKSAERVVEEARSLGFYVGLEAYRLDQISRQMRLALNTSDPLEILAYQQDVITTSEEVIRSVQSILEEAYANEILVFIIVILLSLAIGAIFIERKDQYATFTIISFLILMSISYHTFPGFSRVSTQDLMIGVYLTIFIVLIAFLAPYFIGEMKSERGVSLIPALLIAISYSVGNLKKRRLRTLLILISLVAVIIAMSTLTSVRASFATNALTVTKTWMSDRPSISIVTRLSGFLTPVDLAFIGSQKEILMIDYKVVSPTAYSALDYVGDVPIYGIRSISRGDPSLQLIKNILYPEDALEKLFADSETVIVSKHLAKSSGIDVGDTIVFRGVRLKVVGVFEGGLIEEVKEPDGSNFLPLYVSPGLQLGPQPTPGNNLLLTSVYTAQKLGGRVSAAYCIFNNSRQVKEVSRRLASLGSYFVTALPSSESITYYFKGGYVEFFGALVIFPLVITILNIAIMFYTLVYERRNEIFIFSSVGLNPTHISSLFIIEAGVLGFIGGGIGYILSMIVFKSLDILNIVFPVDIKVSPIDMLSLIIVASLTAIVSSVLPALKAAKIATPSLLRRWKMEEKTVRGGTWIMRIPIKIPSEKVDAFINYLYERLPQSSTAIELVISEVKREEKADENGNITYFISFNYGRGGNRPFNARTMIEIRKDVEDYIAYVHTSPRSMYASMIEANVHEVVTHIRKLVLEWSALKFNVAMAIGESIEPAFVIAKKYRPQLLLVYSRRDLGDGLKELRRKLRSEGVWPPAIKVKKLVSRDIGSLAEILYEEIKSADAVCLDSDDGILSSALLIAAIQLDKNIVAVDPQGNIQEVPARKLVENI
jgi:ABC-type antimicrobial peptide transport system permease subunit